MGLLDQLAGSLLGSLTGQAGAAGAAGGTGAAGAISPALIQQVIGMLGNNAQGGGLGGLMAAFEQGGLGHIFQSWVSNGANLPVSPAQLQQVLGNGQLAQIAQALGLDHGTAAGGLAQVLPQIVSHLTPNGQLPAAGEASAALQALAKQLMPS